jgi:molybdopterin molybdotransferase
MIAIKDAFSLLEATSISLKEEEMSLDKGLNFVLAETLFSPLNMPPFRQSNMDGYALALYDGIEYSLVGELKAGDSNAIELQPGQALKIFTGAAVPDSAEAVIQIEKVTLNGSQLLLQEPVAPETNVRPMGSQISKGSQALEKGTLLNPAALGFLAGLGFTSIKVYPKPSIGIVITGNELVPAGQPLPHGKVYESNALMLQTALRNEQFEDVSLHQVQDDFESTKSVLEKAIEAHDVVLISGGISVGDYDFVGRALESLPVETLFHKVNQKPGKPLLVGKKNDKMIFALPGNPAASLTCFYIYVKPTLKRLSGQKVSYSATVNVVLAHDYEVNNSRDQFLKATVFADQVTILSHQDSSMLDSFALANGLVYLSNGTYSLTQGVKVAVYLL